MKTFRIKRKYVHIAMVLLLIIILVILFSIYYYHTQIATNKNYPVIEFTDEYETEISVQVTEMDLLKGVRAFDAEDNDLTANIAIEQMSNLIKGNRREIVYVVSDSDNNVTKITKEIQYTDYKPPVLRSISKNPVIEERKYSEILDCFRATDVIDGDISEKIKIESVDTSADSISSGVFPVEVSVTNSCGDTVYLKSTVTLFEQGGNAR